MIMPAADRWGWIRLWWDWIILAPITRRGIIDTSLTNATSSNDILSNDGKGLE